MFRLPGADPAQRAGPWRIWQPPRDHGTSCVSVRVCRTEQRAPSPPETDKRSLREGAGITYFAIVAVAVVQPGPTSAPGKKPNQSHLLELLAAAANVCGGFCSFATLNPFCYH